MGQQQPIGNKILKSDLYLDFFNTLLQKVTCMLLKIDF